MQQALNRGTGWRKSPSARRQVAAAVEYARQVRKREKQEIPGHPATDEIRAAFQSHDPSAAEYGSDERAPGVDASTSEDSFTGDYGLGLYLQQMGTVPLLSREAELELARRLDDALVEIKVSDTGCGVEADCLPRIFEPFFTGFDVSHHSSGQRRSVSVRFARHMAQFRPNLPCAAGAGHGCVRLGARSRRSASWRHE